MSLKYQVACKPALATLAVIAWVGVLLQLWLSINLALTNGKAVVDGIVIYFGYFTVLTNLFVALVATLPLIANGSSLGNYFSKPVVLGSATTSIIMVLITYHFLLRNVWQPQGLQLIVDIVMHYVVPVLTLAYWLIFSPRSNLSILAPITWCLYPLSYLIYVLVRGELLESYPYYFIDVTKIGYEKVLLNSFGLLVAFIILGFVVLGVTTLRNRLYAPNPVKSE